jgi:hypothetical protein
VEVERVMTPLTLRLRHLMCGLGGHEFVLHFEHDHLSLQCLLCGYQSSGWNLRADADSFSYGASSRIDSPPPPPDGDPARPPGLLEGPRGVAFAHGRGAS